MIKELRRRAILDRVRVKGEQVFNGGMFNGLEYQLVTNPVTGRTWLDRNLGATRVAQSVNDSEAYGWLYQWGRLSDGHQLRDSSTRSEQSTTDVPGHSDFITTSISPFDWRNPQNDLLWQGVDGINNPCPPGFRIPTIAEWIEQKNTYSTLDAYGAYNSELKITLCGFKSRVNGIISSVTTRGLYSSSSVNGINIITADVRASNIVESGAVTRSDGCAVRAIRDEEFD